MPSAKGLQQIGEYTSKNIPTGKRMGTAPMGSSGRPRTAAMPIEPGSAGINRPMTGATGFPGGKGMNAKNSLSRFTPAAAGRAASAGISKNQKLIRCEQLIARFKRKLEEEKRLLRMMKTMSAKEIETKNMLEKVLKQCVDDVKAEIAKKRSENKSIYYAKGKKGRVELEEERNLTH